MIALWTTSDIMAPLLAALPQLGPVYIVLLIVGGGLLVISTVFGGDADAGGDIEAGVDVDLDADVSADTPTDVDAAHGHETGAAVSLASWFSIHFLVYFCAMFGVIGTVLSYLSETSPPAVLGLAVLGGIVAGQGVHQALRYLRRSSGDSKVAKRDFVNKLARVTVAPGPSQKGEVAVQIRGRERFIIAVTHRADDQFKIGDTVGIVAFVAGKVEVVSREEFEFITKS